MRYAVVSVSVWLVSTTRCLTVDKFPSYPCRESSLGGSPPFFLHTEAQFKQTIGGFFVGNVMNVYGEWMVTDLALARSSE